MHTLEAKRLIIRPFYMSGLEEAHHLLDGGIQWAGPGRSLEYRREKLTLHIALAHNEDTGCLCGCRALK